MKIRSAAVLLAGSLWAAAPAVGDSLGLHDFGRLLGGTGGGAAPDPSAVAPLLEMFGALGDLGNSGRQEVASLPAQIPDLRDCRGGLLDLPLPLDASIYSAGLAPDPRTFERMEPLVAMMFDFTGTEGCEAQVPWLLHALVAYGRGRFNEADAVFRQVLPPLEAGAASLMLLAHVARASIMVSQANHDAAETLLAALKPRAEAAFGPNSPATIGITGAIGDVQFERMEFEAARRTYDQVHSQAAAALGINHPLVCLALHSRADTLLRLGDLNKSEALLQQLLDPATGRCTSDWTADLRARARQIRGMIAIARGDLAAAEADLSSARKTVTGIRGATHPHAIAATLALAELRALEGRTDEAVVLASELDESLIAWLGREVQESTVSGARRSLVGAQARYQNFAVRLALRNPGHAGAQHAAATAILRHKGMQAEEEAALARLARSQTVPEETRRLAAEVAQRQEALAVLFNNPAGGGDAAEIAERMQALEAAEMALSRASGLYGRQLATRSATVEAVQVALAARPGPAVLVEYRRLRDYPFGAPETGAAPDILAAVMVSADAVWTAAIGPTDEIDEVTQTLANPLAAAQPASIDRLGIERRLFDLLVTPLEIEEYDEVFLAPEGTLALLPFPAFRDADGRHWTEHPDQMLHLVQTGRVLLPGRPVPDGAGLVAFGGIDFGLDGEGLFKPLPASADEAAAVHNVYEAAVGPATLFEEASATEARLRALDSPHVLHLATHGFYNALDPGDPKDPRSAATAERPLLLSGLALAGANVAGETGEGEGILHALEASELPLQGTELVVLSACLAGQGLAERGEGLHGLARAFRIAGARHSLVALYPVRDTDARDFAKAFYRHWLSGQERSLQEAYRATVAEILETDSPVEWRAFALFRN